MPESSSTKFKLKLEGNTAVFIDWANVYNWKSSLKQDVSAAKIFTYLKEYSEIKDIRFYFGTDKTHPASAEFLKDTRKIGYSVITKDVKFLKVYSDDMSKFVWKRKCDLDLEIGLDAMELVEDFKTFIFFSGDGDFKTLYERLIKLKKHVVVVYMYGHLGREIWELKKGLFKVALKKLGDFGDE